MADEPVTVGRWNATIRRHRFGRRSRIKTFALVLSSYAEADGTGIRPGIARAATDSEIGESTARRYLHQLRQLGLILLTVPGNRRAGRADEYRLTISAQFEQDTPSREEYAAIVAAAKSENRAQQKRRRIDSALSKASDKPTDHDHSSALSMVSADDVDQRSVADLSALTMESAHLPGITSPEKGHLPPGGAPPPDPRRPLAASPQSTGEQRSLCEPHTAAQDQQGESLPREGARADARARAEVGIPPTDPG